MENMETEPEQHEPNRTAEQSTGPPMAEDKAEQQNAAEQASDRPKKIPRCQVGEAPFVAGGRRHAK